MTRGWLFCLFLLLLLCSTTAAAQDTLPRRLEDENKRLEQQKLREKAIRDSIFYSQVKKKMSKNNLLKKIYGALFRDPFRSNVSTPQPVKRTKFTYARFNGKYIGEIYVRRIKVFGPTVEDTLRPPTWVEKIGNSLHVNTQKVVIKNTLLVKRGEKFDAALLSDNERLLRQSPYLLDARIIPLRRPDVIDTIDLLVITQDVWSISGDVSIAGPIAGSVSISDKNMLGLGHDFRNHIRYDYNAPRAWGYSGMYRVPYIGKTFITGEAEYTDYWDRQVYAVRLRRNFLTPTTRYAGGAEVGWQRRFGENLFKDTTIMFPFAYRLEDLWVGRAFRLKVRSEAWQERSRLIMAMRIRNFHYDERPAVRADTNQLYQDRQTLLMSIGFTDRGYYRDVLIYGFGRTEDVPYGTVFSITTGYERSEFNKRAYFGLRIANAEFHQRLGYLFLNFYIGGFLRRDNRVEQGAALARVNYFSKLLTIKRFNIRQFITVTGARGINRFPNEFMDINSNNGIRGASSKALRGDKKLVFNFETTIFTPYDVLGFRVAAFVFADVGFISYHDQSILASRVGQGYGIGLRFRNEHLALNTFQVRLGFYPGIPGISNPLRSSFSGIPVLRLPEFDIGAPDVVPYY